jgi:hypothetical protein
MIRRCSGSFAGSSAGHGFPHREFDLRTAVAKHLLDLGFAVDRVRSAGRPCRHTVSSCSGSGSELSPRTIEIEAKASRCDVVNGPPTAAT